MNKLSLNVVELPALDVDGPKNIAAQFRALADAVDSGKFPKLRTALVVLDYDDGVDFCVFGLRPRKSDSLGLLEFAKNLCMDDHCDE